MTTLYREEEKKGGENKSNKINKEKGVMVILLFLSAMWSYFVKYFIKDNYSFIDEAGVFGF
jgi:hypothetical protein